MIEANKPKVFADAIGFGGSSSGGSVPVAEIPLDEHKSSAGRRLYLGAEAVDQGEPRRDWRDRSWLG